MLFLDFNIMMNEKCVIKLAEPMFLQKENYLRISKTVATLIFRIVPIFHSFAQPSL